MSCHISKEQYLNNPCGSLSTAYWKSIDYPVPKNIKIFHKRNYEGMANATKYFRLFHDLNDINATTNNDYITKTVNIETDDELVARILSECYDADYTEDFVNGLTKARVFDNDLWILAIETSTSHPVALGIADYDADIKEGSIEWIQVLPNKRGLGLGKLIVNELLLRLKAKADFVTVSGEIDNKTNPETLYRKCGFTGNDIWYVVRT